MHLRKHDLLDMDDEWLKKLLAERLLEVSIRLLDDVKALQDRQIQNPGLDHLKQSVGAGHLGWSA